MLTLFKLANYGLGGQYEPHMDSETVNKPNFKIIYTLHNLPYIS